MGKSAQKNILRSSDDFAEKDLSRLFFIVLTALLATFFLVPVEKYLLPWPWFLEEILKCVVIWYLILPVRCWYCRLLFSLAFVLVFAVGENILYFPFFADLQDINKYWQRFIYPLGMHLLTFYILLFSAWKYRWGIIGGLIVALFIHYYYNNWALSFFAL